MSPLQSHSGLSLPTYSELFLEPVDFEFGPVTDQVEDQTLEIFNRRIQRNYDLSTYLISYAIGTAVYLKSTSIPDRITNVAANVLEVGSVLDQHYAIKSKVKDVSAAAVSAIISIFATLVTAILQFLIAFNNAPGKGRILEDDRVVNLSIGGERFTSRFDNFAKYRDSTLYRLVENSNGDVFIDRDGKDFRHVLNYIRGIDSIQHITDGSTLSDLLEECRFYQIQELVEHVKRKLEELELDLSNKLLSTYGRWQFWNLI